MSMKNGFALIRGLDGVQRLIEIHKFPSWRTLFFSQLNAPNTCSTSHTMFAKLFGAKKRVRNVNFTPEIACLHLNFESLRLWFPFWINTQQHAIA